MQKILIVIIITVLFFFGGIFLIKKAEERKNIDVVKLCSKAYSCIVEKNNKELQHCKTTNEKGKEIDVDCKSFSMCLYAYNCHTDENDYERASCKVKQSDQVYDITCPNSFCNQAYYCLDKDPDSDLLYCKYMDVYDNEVDIKCPKNY